MIIAHDSLLSDGVSSGMINIAGDFWVPESSFILDADTIWVSVCAADADSETGCGEDTSMICTEPFPFVCRKPFISILQDTIDFGSLCIDSSALDSFGVANPTEIEVDFSVDVFGSACFVISGLNYNAQAGETVFVPVEFSPLDEAPYLGEVFVLLEDAQIGNVVLIGSGELCPLCFSAEPRMITPNNDGKYDCTIFTFPLSGDNKIEIFAKTFFKVKTIRTGTITTYWDGTDDAGRECPIGAYLFVAFSGSDVLGKGVIIIAR